MTTSITQGVSSLKIGAAEFVPTNGLPGSIPAVPNGTANGNSYGDHRQVVLELMDRLCMGGAEAKGAAEEIAMMVLGSGVTSMDTYGFTQQLTSAADDMNTATAREGALLAYKYVGGWTRHAAHATALLGSSISLSVANSPASVSLQVLRRCVWCLRAGRLRSRLARPLSPTSCLCSHSCWSATQTRLRPCAQRLRQLPPRWWTDSTLAQHH